MNEWGKYTVQDLIDKQMIAEPMDGNHGSIHPKSSDYISTGIPFIMANDLVNGVIDFDNCAFISEKQANTLKKGFAHPKDVLLTHKATIGRTAIVPDKYETIILTPQVTYYRVLKGIDNRYLKYYFDSSFFQNTLNNWAGSGSTRAYIGITAQRKLPIILPPLTIQTKIANILSLLDDKIAVNTAINENLQHQSQAVFKDLIADVQKRVPFTSVIQVLGGGTPKTGKQEYWNGEIPFFTPKDVGSPYVLSTEKNITPIGLDNCNSRLYPVNTVFLTARGTVGKVSLAGVPMSMNQSCYALVGKNNLHQILIYHYILETVKALKHKASGAVFDAIITRDFDTESVPALSSKQIEDFLGVAIPIYSDILNRTFENQHLSAIRDTLLPKLMNGEIDVSEVKI